MANPIHYLKSRNSDYLAGTDLEIFELEGKSKILTVKNVLYLENFLVNGRKKDKGLVVYFAENYAKPMIVNTTNSREIKKQTGIIDASKWVGLSFEFYYDMKVSMKVSKTEIVNGGVRIKKVITNGLIAAIDDYEKRLEQVTNKTELLSLWQELDEQKQIELKDLFSTKQKTL